MIVCVFVYLCVCTFTMKKGIIFHSSFRFACFSVREEYKFENVEQNYSSLEEMK